MSINLGLIAEKEFNCIVGFSGKIIDQKDLSSRIKSKVNTLLIHGDADQVVQRIALERFNSEATDIRKLYNLGKFVITILTLCFIVFVALGITAVQVAPFDNLSGGYCHQAGPDPMSFVLKAGALGDKTFMFTALERMRQADQPED